MAAATVTKCRKSAANGHLDEKPHPANRRRNGAPGVLEQQRSAPAAENGVAPASACEGPAAKPKFRLVKAEKSRQREVEKAKSMIYGALPEIIGGIIKEAIAGNHNAAKFLMQYAGIGEFSAAVRAADKAKAEAVPEREPLTPEEAVESLYKQLGMKPPVLLPPGVKPEDLDENGEWWRKPVEREGSPPEWGVVENGT